METVGQHVKPFNTYLAGPNFNDSIENKYHGIGATTTVAAALVAGGVLSLMGRSLPVVGNPALLSGLAYAANLATRYATHHIDHQQYPQTALYGEVGAETLERGLVFGALAASLICLARSPSGASLIAAGVTGGFAALQIAEPIYGPTLYAHHGQAAYEKLEEAYGAKGNTFTQYYAGEYFRLGGQKQPKSRHFMGIAATTLGLVGVGYLLGRASATSLFTNSACIATFGFVANRTGRYLAGQHINRRNGYKPGELAMDSVWAVGLPALRGVAFGALAASLARTFGIQARLLALAATAAVATAQAVEPKHQDALIGSISGWLIKPVVV